MFDIFIKSHFSAGHHLRDYPGNCERPHGHNWKVEVTVRATELDSLGMGIDFKTLKKAVNKVLDRLDHHNLNDHPDFQTINPSSENIAVFIFREVQQEIASDRCSVHSVTACETDNSCVTYFGP